MGANEIIDGKLTLQLHEVPREYISVMWPKVKADAEKIKSDLGESWISEDVYHELKTGESALIVGLTGNDYVGCLIYRITIEQHTQRRKMFIWIAALHSDGFEQSMDFVKQVAAKHGASVIQFESPRRGWEKRAKLVKSVYEIEVTA